MASSDKLINLVIAGGIVYFGVQFINSGKLQPIIDQLMAGLGGGGTMPGGGAPAGAPSTGTGTCDCSCMPMDGDPTRMKIETAAGEDCANNEYFGPENAAGLCAAKLTEICLARGGTTTPPAGGTKPAGGGGGDEESGGGDEESDGGDEEDSNYARIAYYLLMRR